MQIVPNSANCTFLSHIPHGIRQTVNKVGSLVVYAPLRNIWEVLHCNVDPESSSLMYQSYNPKFCALAFNYANKMCLCYYLVLYYMEDQKLAYLLFLNESLLGPPHRLSETHWLEWLLLVERIVLSWVIFSLHFMGCLLTVIISNCILSCKGFSKNTNLSTRN